MINLRLKLAVVAAVLAGLSITDIASAQLGDDLLYGLQLYGVRFQKKYDPLTKGYQLNVSLIDPDTGLPFYNDTNFYLGFADLTLELTVPARSAHRLSTRRGWCLRSDSGSRRRIRPATSAR